MTSRRDFIRQSALTSAAVLAPACSFSIGNRNIQPDDVIVGHGSYKNKVDKRWAKISVTISSPGGTEPVYTNNVLQPTLQQPTPVFQHGHDVCVDDDKNVYVCQWNGNYTAPVKLTRVG